MWVVNFAAKVGPQPEVTYCEIWTYTWHSHWNGLEHHHVDKSIAHDGRWWNEGSLCYWLYHSSSLQERYRGHQFHRTWHMPTRLKSEFCLTCLSVREDSLFPNDVGLYYADLLCLAEQNHTRRKNFNFLIKADSAESWSSRSLTTSQNCTFHHQVVIGSSPD